MATELAEKKILIVEDEYFVASDLRRALTAAGAIVAGPTGNLRDGLALVSETEIAAAVLDVNLEGEMSYPIADALTARGVPYLFLTGYDGWALPERFQDATHVAKPFRMETVLALLAKLVADG